MARVNRPADSEWYPSFARAIRRAGFLTAGVEHKHGWSRTTVCSEGAERVYGGNSFWVTSIAGQWYLGSSPWTWGSFTARRMSSG
jgi:hypothetical protein